MLHNLDKSKKDVYILLSEMSENINKLFSSLGIQEEKSDLQIPPRLIAMIEALVNSGGMVAENMEQLNSRLKTAYDKSEEIRLINRAYANNEKDLNREINLNKTELSSLQSQVDEIKQQNCLSEKTCDNLQNELLSLKDKYESDTRSLKRQYLDNIMLLITFRDGILMKEGLAESQGEQKLQSMLASLMIETANILEKNQVIILDQKGVFDSSKQIVVDIVETTEEALQNTIAQVFRPGYSFEDEMIRPQEVVLYKYKRP